MKNRPRQYLERRRWPERPECPKCGHGEAYKLTAREGSTKPGRKGPYKCKSCRKQFTATVGTIFKDSHIPLNKWLIAIVAQLRDALARTEPIHDEGFVSLPRRDPLLQVTPPDEWNAQRGVPCYIVGDRILAGQERSD